MFFLRCHIKTPNLLSTFLQCSVVHRYSKSILKVCWIWVWKAYRIEYSVNSQCRYSTEIVLPRYYMKDTDYFKIEYVYFIAGKRHEEEDQFSNEEEDVERVADEIPSEFGGEAGVFLKIC